MAGLVKEYISPSLAQRANSMIVNSWGAECNGLAWSLTFTTNPGSAVYTANLVVYVPFSLAFPVRISQFFWVNGTAIAGNTDVGIYSLDGSTKLGSTGSTLNAGTSTIQVVDVADFTLPSNSILWLALGCDDGAQTFYRKAVTAATILEYAGIKQQASGWSSGLPSSATFATPSVAYLPLFGFSGGFV